MPNFTVMSPSVFREILEQLVPQNNIFVVEFPLEKPAAKACEDASSVKKTYSREKVILGVKTVWRLYLASLTRLAA